MSLKKMFKRSVRALYNPKTMIKGLTNTKYALGGDDKSKSGAAGPAAESPQDQLNDALKDYSNVNQTAAQGVLDDSKAAGTYADTPAAQIQRQGEADAEARYGHRAALTRINSLQTQLGLPVTPADQLPATPTSPAQAPQATLPAPNTALPNPNPAPKPAVTV